MSVLFISYRRSDSQDVTGRIYDRLVAKFTKEQVFRDIDNIPIGITFPVHLKQMLGKCGAVLIVIGRDWVTVADAQGRRRLDDPNDFVRVEVETALRAKVPVIPVLVSNAGMPTAGELPPSIRSLVTRNGIAVRPDPDFGNDMDRLIRGIEHVLNLPIQGKSDVAREPKRAKDANLPTNERGPIHRSRRRSPVLAFAVPMLAVAVTCLALPLAYFVWPREQGSGDTGKKGDKHGNKGPAPIILPFPDNDNKQPPKEISVASIGLVMRWIPPGTFLMGTPQAEISRLKPEFGNFVEAEGPQHEVEITRWFVTRNPARSSTSSAASTDL